MDNYMCQYCGLEIRTKDTTCPACGHSDLKKKPEKLEFKNYYIDGN